VPIDACLATCDDQFRKPGTGAWQYYLGRGAGALRPAGTGTGTSGSGGGVVLGDCFYCGDAAGRPADHSDSDRLFAAAAGLRFMTPGECFGDRGGGGCVGSDPLGGIGSPGPDAPPLPLAAIARDVATAAPVVLVLVGHVGSGKSTFASSLLERAATKMRSSSASSASAAACPARWEVVCQDVLGSKDRCEAAVSSALVRGRSVVVDRTNLTPDQRAAWAGLAAGAGAALHAVCVATPVATCRARVEARDPTAHDVAGAKGLLVLARMLRQGPAAPMAAEGFRVVAEARKSADLKSLVDAYAL